MNRDWYKTLTWLMWLTLPLAAWEYWRVWDQLPARMAVHFDANWHANGFSSREGALELGLGVVGFILLACTIAALLARAFQPSASWPVLMISYVVLGFGFYGNYSIVKYNLNAPPAHSELVGPEFPGAK